MAKWTHVNTKIPNTARVIIAYSRHSGSMHTAKYIAELKAFLTNTINPETLKFITHWAEIIKSPD